MLPSSSLARAQSTFSACCSQSKDAGLQGRAALVRNGGTTRMAFSFSKGILNSGNLAAMVASKDLTWLSASIGPARKCRGLNLKTGALADAQRADLDVQMKPKALDRKSKPTNKEEVQGALVAEPETAGETEKEGNILGSAETVIDPESEIKRDGQKDIEGKNRETSSRSEDMEDIEVEKGYKMGRVCDRLIEVFLVEKTKPAEWRLLLAFSEEWVRIRPYFFKRCKSRAKAEEDPKKKADLLKLARRLQKVDDDMLRHDELLAEIEKTSMELDTLVARRRKDFTGDFFQHLRILCDASYTNPNRRDDIASIAARCLAGVEAYDSASEDNEALSIAQLKFDDILSSPSLEAAAKKIDNLAKHKELDSTLMLLITKAWAAAKESTMMKDEVKDIMYHLYNVARGNMSRLVPKEVRIIRHLLSIEDPRERFTEMTNAFSPGDELEGKDTDDLYTTPDKLLKWIQIVLEAFYSNKKGTLIKEAQNLMNPSVISRLEILKEVLEHEFM